MFALLLIALAASFFVYRRELSTSQRQAIAFPKELAVAFKDGKAGYIDKQGHWAIQPQFGTANEFSEGLALVSYSKFTTVMEYDRKMRFGYIDAGGSFVIKPQFGFGGQFSEGLAAVQVDGKWGYIDRTGAFVVEPQFINAWKFIDGRATVELGDLNQFCINKDGKRVVSDKGQDGSQTWRVIKPEEIVESPTDTIFVNCANSPVGGHPSGDLKPVYIGGQCCGYVADVSGELRPIWVDGKWGYIDSAGRFVIALQFFQVTPFNGGVALVSVSLPRFPFLAYQFIGTDGKNLFAKQFELAEPFDGDLALVEEGGSVGYINRDGTWAIRTDADTAGHFVKVDEDNDYSSSDGFIKSPSDVE